MTNFVYDLTTLNGDKINLSDIPIGADPKQYLQATYQGDWNDTVQAIYDLRGVLWGGVFYGLTPKSHDPSQDQSVPDYYLWLKNTNELFLHTPSGNTSFLTSARQIFTDAVTSGLQGGGSLDADLSLSIQNIYDSGWTSLWLGSFTGPWNYFDINQRGQVVSGSFKSYIENPSGTDGQLLSHNSGQPGGVSWIDPPVTSKTLQGAYTDGGAGPQVIQLTASGKGVLIYDASPSLDTEILFGVGQDSGGFQPNVAVYGNGNADFGFSGHDITLGYSSYSTSVGNGAASVDLAIGSPQFTMGDLTNKDTGGTGPYWISSPTLGMKGWAKGPDPATSVPMHWQQFVRPFLLNGINNVGAVEGSSSLTYQLYSGSSWLDVFNLVYLNAGAMGPGRPPVPFTVLYCATETQIMAYDNLSGGDGPRIGIQAGKGDYSSHNTGTGGSVHVQAGDGYNGGDVRIQAGEAQENGDHLSGNDGTIFLATEGGKALILGSYGNPLADGIQINSDLAAALTINMLGVGPATDGLVIKNKATSSSGQQYWSPNLRLTGNADAESGGPFPHTHTSTEVHLAFNVQTLAGMLAPRGKLCFQYAIGNGAYTSFAYYDLVSGFTVPSDLHLGSDVVFTPSDTGGGTHAFYIGYSEAGAGDGIDITAGAAFGGNQGGTILIQGGMGGEGSPGANGGAITFRAGAGGNYSGNGGDLNLYGGDLIHVGFSDAGGNVNIKSGNAGIQGSINLTAVDIYFNGAVHGIDGGEE